MRNLKLSILTLLLLGASICITSCSKDDNKGGVNNPHVGNSSTQGRGSFSFKVVDKNGKTFTKEGKGNVLIYSDDTITQAGETLYDIAYYLETDGDNSTLITIGFRANSAISNLKKGESIENVSIINEDKSGFSIASDIFDAEHAYMAEGLAIIASDKVKMFIKKITYLNDFVKYGVQVGKHYRIEGGRIETDELILNNGIIQKVELNFEGVSIFNP